MSSPLIAVSHLFKSVTDVTGTLDILRDIDFTLNPQQTLAIVGASGSGKSTLLAIMAGLDTPTQGTVHLAGQDIFSLNEDQRAALRASHIGFVFQAFHVLPHLDVAQNVGLPLLLLGTPDAQRVQAMLQAVGLDGLGARLPQTLSGGQLQRVAIARALVHRPGLLLADEPTGNWDPSPAAVVMDALRAQCRAQGASLVLVTHSDAAARDADRVLQLGPNGISAV